MSASERLEFNSAARLVSEQRESSHSVAAAGKQHFEIQSLTQKAIPWFKLMFLRTAKKYFEEIGGLLKWRGREKEATLHGTQKRGTTKGRRGKPGRLCSNSAVFWSQRNRGASCWATRPQGPQASGASALHVPGDGTLAGPVRVPLADSATGSTRPQS